MLSGAPGSTTKACTQRVKPDSLSGHSSVKTITPDASVESGAMIRTGGAWLSIVRICTVEVWVRRSLPESK